MSFDEQIHLPILHLIGEQADTLHLPCYVVGGWVRDLLLHRGSKDIDVVVVGSGIDLARAVAKALGKDTTLSVFKTYGTAQVKHHDTELEFVGARKESYHTDSRNPIVSQGTLEEDQQRRDFTINALAICLNKDHYGDLLDPFNGVQDLQECVIRTPLDPDITFSDDPLRMLRAVRFATQLGFYLDTPTFDAIQRNAGRLDIITRERVSDELNKIMLARKPSVGWDLLDKLQLLPHILPELVALKGITIKEYVGHKDIFLHTMQVLDNVCEAQEHQDPPRPETRLWLRWAALLHDIGKPHTKEWNGHTWTFYNHNYVGEKMVPNIFKSLKLPLNEKMEYVQKIVGLHMRPINLVEETVTDSAVRRLLFEAGDDIDDLMLLCHADITSKNAQKVSLYHKNFTLVQQKMLELEARDKIRNFQPPIDGLEIMDLLHLSPCRVVGEIKNAIKDAILDGIIPNDYVKAKEYMYQLAKEKQLL